MFECDICSHEFTTKQSLSYHLKNKVCTKHKKMFLCVFCPKSYKSKQSFLKHLNKKHRNNNFVPKKQINDKQCKKCGIIFSRKDSLKRHIKNSCKKVHITNNINNINNTTYNNCNNNYNNTNITINNFGRESMNSISDEDIQRCVNMCYDAIPALFKLIHIDTPENRNLYLTNIKNPFIYTYKNDKWILSEMKYILNYVQSGKRDIIEEHIENNKKKFKKFKINNIECMLKKYKNGELDKRYNSKLKLLLINNSKILQKTYEKTNNNEC